MDRSLLANLIDTGTYLRHFNNEYLEQLEECIYKQIGCDNRAQLNMTIMEFIDIRIDWYWISYCWKIMINIQD